MVERVLVTGAHGQLGSEFLRLAQGNEQLGGNSLLFAGKNVLDITDTEELAAYVGQHSVTGVINCAAYTAVDKAESESALAGQVNRDGAAAIARVCKLHDIGLIHISTDYVFDGNTQAPYREDDSTNPQCVYGTTKLAGEQAVLDILPNSSLIIRTSWLYSTFGSNFVKTMLRLGKEREQIKVVNDQVGSPTYARDLAKAIVHIINQNFFNNTAGKNGIYHFADRGECSWYDFAREIFLVAEVPCEVLPIPTSEYPTPAKRPAYSVMATEKIQQTFDLDIPLWQNSLRDCLERMS